MLCFCQLLGDLGHLEHKMIFAHLQSRRFLTGRVYSYPSYPDSRQNENIFETTPAYVPWSPSVAIFVANLCLRRITPISPLSAAPPMPGGHKTLLEDLIIINIIISIIIIIIIMLAPPTWNCPCSSLTRASWFWISNFSRVIRCRS